MLVSGWRLANQLAQQWSAYDFRSAFDVVPGLDYGVGIGVMAVVTYFALMPLLRNWLPMPTSFSEISYGQPRFVAATSTALYVAAGAGLVLAAARAQLSQPQLSALFLVWLVPLIVLLSFTPLVLVALTSLARRRRSLRAVTEANIITKLLRLLTTLGKVGSLETLWGPQRRHLADQIRGVSQAMRRLYYERASLDKAEEWARAQMEIAADNVLVLSSWLHLPQVSTLQAVRQRVISVSNAFLTGQLHDLPREALSHEQGLALPRRRRQAITTALRTLAVMAYAAAPIVGYVMLRLRLTPVVVPDTLLLVLMGYLVDSSSHYILGVGVPALVASTIVL